MNTKKCITDTFESSSEFADAKRKTFLREGFAVPDLSYRTIPFYHLEGDISRYDVIYDELRNTRRMGYGGVAILPVHKTVPQGFTEEYYTALGNMLDQIDKLKMSAIYYDDVDFPSGHAGYKLLKKYPETETKAINHLEFSDVKGLFSETIPISDEMREVIISAVAVKDDDKTLVDMTSCFEGNTVSYTLPEGNYTVYVFTCRTQSNHERLDFLNYEHTQKFIELTYDEALRRFPEHMGSTIKMTFYDDIRYLADNGRAWQYEMKEAFIKEYGIDPTPYYPALVTDIGEDTMWFRAAFMSLRAKMLSEGFFKAVGDWGKKNNLITTGHVAGPGNTDPTNTVGDLMQFQQYVGAPGQDAIHGYMYIHSRNAFKMTSSSAYNYDKNLVVSEIYGNYPENSGMSILYSEAIHAFTRGINYLIPHGMWLSDTARIPPMLSHKSPIYSQGLQDLNTFLARCQYMLQGGRHVADIGLLYPVRSLQAQSTLTYCEGTFKTNPPPENADYMNVINTIVNYCNKDLTVLHPETINKRIKVRGNVLELDNKMNYEQYRVIVIPSSVMIELSNLEKIKEFYDNGGKVIATGVLPYLSYEKGKNEQVTAIIEEMFGNPVAYSEKTNTGGGKTYYIPDCGVLLDENCDSVDPDVMYDVLEEALSVYDVKIADKLAISDHGYFNYIHKVKDGVNLYYFGNASNTPVDTYAEIRGKIVPELWNPVDGSMKKADYEYVTKDGEVVTRVKLVLSGVQSVFVTDVSDVENNRVLFKDIFADGTEKWNNPQSVSEGKLAVASTTTANGTRALSDFVLKIKADTTSETGILFRMLDEYDNYNWNFYNRDGSIVLVPEIMLNGKEIILEEVPTNIPVSENTEISIECVQDTIKTCINSKQVSLVHDKAQRYGEIGFKKGRFAEVTVTMLP